MDMTPLGGKLWFLVNVNLRHRHLALVFLTQRLHNGSHHTARAAYFASIVKPIKIALRENMAYDALRDEYICQNEKKLGAVYVGKRKSKSGFESEITYYECESCEGCTHKKNCTRSKGSRTLQVSKKFIEQRRQSLKRITGEKGTLLRINRSIQVEGAFGVIKQDYGFRQFLLRGNKKVLTELLLVAMGNNLNKFHNKIQQNRTGTQLFEKLTA